MLERTYIAEYGSIDVTDEVSAFIVRDETVYIAAQASSVNRLAEADKLVKANTHVVELTPKDESKESEVGKNGNNVTGASGNMKSKYSAILEELGDSVKTTEEGYNKGAGYVSYYVDGAEAKLSTSSLDSLHYEDYKSLTGRKAMETPKKNCDKGDPTFKVVKNAKWYLVYYIRNSKAEKYVPGDTVVIDVGGNPVEVTVSQVLNGRKWSRITLSCKTFFDGFFEERNLDTTVTVRHAEGLILRDDSIVESPDGKIGVFVKNKLGEHIFKPIAIKADDGEQCVVYADIYVDEGGNYVETVGTYDEIIAEPSEEDMAALQAEVEAEEKEKAEAEAEAAKAKAEAEEKAKAEAEAKAKAEEEANNEEKSE